jgi:hypothetical protein
MTSSNTRSGRQPSTHLRDQTVTAAILMPVPDARLGPMFARLLAAHGDTGLWPLLLTEMSAPAGVLMPVISEVSADLIRARLYPPGRPWHKPGARANRYHKRVPYARR